MDKTVIDHNSTSTMVDGVFFAKDYILPAIIDSTTRTNDLHPCLSDVWFADNGATWHMTRHRHWFSSFKSIPKGQWPIYGINSQLVYMIGIRRICIDRQLNGQWCSGYLNEVLYIPTLTSNMFSMSRAANKGIDTICTRHHCYLTTRNTIQMEGVQENMLYHLLIQVTTPDSYLYAADISTSTL